MLSAKDHGLQITDNNMNYIGNDFIENHITIVIFCPK